MALILMDEMQGDIDRGCRFVVDLGGYTYYLIDSPYAQEAAAQEPGLAAAGAGLLPHRRQVLSIRFNTTAGFSNETAKTIESWPIIVKSGRYEVRQPQPSNG